MTSQHASEIISRQDWKPLTGVRVLEFGQIYAAPLTGLILADLGADVVKVEPPSGDGMRSWGPFLNHDGCKANHPSVSLSFSMLNRNKRSIILDLKTTTGVEHARDLLAQCDVILENFRPGTLDRLGLSFKKISELNPRIVYCSISGFGQTGTEVQRGAYDVVVQGYSGLMSVTGESADRPVKCGVPVADAVAGLYAALSITSALASRNKRQENAANNGSTGSTYNEAPIYLDCAMLDSLISISGLQLAQLFGTGISPVPLATAHPSNAPYQMFQASDAPFILAAGNDSLWERVCDVLEDSVLRDDLRFATQQLRVEKQAELADLLSARFIKDTAASWIERFSSYGVPVGPVHTYSDLVQAPHVLQRGIIDKFELECGCSSLGPLFPVQASYTSTTSEERVTGSVPKLGEHTAKILTEWSSHR